MYHIFTAQIYDSIIIVQNISNSVDYMIEIFCIDVNHGWNPGYSRSKSLISWFLTAVNFLVKLKYVLTYCFNSGYSTILNVLFFDIIRYLAMAAESILPVLFIIILHLFPIPVAVLTIISAWSTIYSISILEYKNCKYILFKMD